MVLVDSIPDYKRTAGDDRNNLNIAGDICINRIIGSGMIDPPGGSGLAEDCDVCVAASPQNALTRVEPVQACGIFRKAVNYSVTEKWMEHAEGMLNAAASHGNFLQAGFKLVFF